MTTAAKIAQQERAALGRQVTTPEGVPISLQLARAGDRAGAFLFDVVILIATLIALAVVAGLVDPSWSGDDTWLTALIIVAAFVLTNFYFIFFELRWRGSTPGKKYLGLRVVDARGGQLEASAVIARNLMRELEVWMPLRALFAADLVWPGAPGWALLLAGGWTFVFLLFLLFNRDRARVGDLVAGTRVVVRPKVVLLPDLVAQTHAMAGPGWFPGARPRTAYSFTKQQLAVYGIYELQVLEEVLRGTSGPDHAAAITAVADKIRLKIGYRDQVPTVNDEAFLRDFYVALRAQLEQKLLLGRRRADKFDAE